MEKHIHLHIRVQRWVIWWLYVGIVCGVVATVNILSWNFTRSQEDIVLMVGLLFWSVGGLICWGLDGVHFQGAQPRGTPSGASEQRSENKAVPAPAGWPRPKG